MYVYLITFRAQASIAGDMKTIGVILKAKSLVDAINYWNTQYAITRVDYWGELNEAQEYVLVKSGLVQAVKEITDDNGTENIRQPKVSATLYC